MSRTTTTHGRPPHLAAEPTQCEWLDDTGRQCGSYAQWTIPEAPYCWHHLPDELRATARAREERWNLAAAHLWLRIVQEIPL